MALQRLSIAPRPARAGGKLVSRVLAFRSGTPLRKGHVWCSARLEGRVVKILANRLRQGTATCVWRVPSGTAGKLMSAVVIVQQGSARTEVRFRTYIRPR